MATASSLAPGVFDAALAIARERAQMLARLRQALIEKKDAEALRIARGLTGLGDESGRDELSKKTPH